MYKVIVHPLTEHTNVILVLSVELKVHVLPSATHFNYTTECRPEERLEPQNTVLGAKQTNKTETR